MVGAARFGAGLGRLVLCGVLAGLVLAACVLPLWAGAGLVALAAGGLWNDLPGNLRTPLPARTTYVYAADGTTLLTTFYDQNRRDVPLSAIPLLVQQAIVAAEDTRFYQHGGIDPKAVVRAFVTNARGGQVAQGASTLTMQYVRNVLKDDPNLTPQQRLEATNDTVGRKLREMRYAAALEQNLSKSEILRRYLNLVYFGNGAYGIDAASRTYFGKSPADLTLPEASLLAGIVQAPDADNPVTGDRAAALDRRTYVLSAMVRAGFITSSQAADSGAQPLALHPTSPPSGCTDIAGGRDDRGFFCDLVHTWWDSQPAFGATVAEREAALRRGGYTIVSSLDVGIQDAALHNVLSVYGYDNPRALPTAVVQPGTGRVLAMAVNRHFRVSATQSAGRNYPDTVNQLIAGDDKLAGYPAGSTFKMFTMLAAVEAGLPLDTGFDAPSRLPTRWVDHGPGNCNGRYCPANANPQWMDGHRTMWDGFGRSVNTYWVWLEEQVGPAKAVAMAQRLGINFRAASDRNLADHQADSWGAFTLGVASTTPLDLANAYATVAADGRYCRPLPVLSITDAAGKAVSAAQPDCRQVIDPDVARAAVDAARCPVGQQSFYHRCDGGTAENVARILGGRPVAGKTGSTDNNSTESFVGFTPQLAAAAIAANPDDPRDLVGAGVSPQVNAAVAHMLAAASGNSRYANFTPPSTAVAFAAPFTSGRRSQAARRR